MIRIVGTTKFKVKCHCCECEYVYDGGDMKKSFFHYYTICPLCNRKNKHKRE